MIDLPTIYTALLLAVVGCICYLAGASARRGKNRRDHERTRGYGFFRNVSDNHYRAGKLR